MGGPRIDFLSNFANPFDNADMLIGQRYGGTTQSGITASNRFIADRWATGLSGSFTYTHEQRGSGRPVVSDGLTHPINNYIQIQADAIVNPTASNVFSIYHRFEAMRIVPWTYRRIKFGFLVNTNKTGTYTVTWNMGVNLSVKYIQSFTVTQANVWERIEMEVDLSPMHTLDTFVYDFNSGLQFNINLAAGPDITNVDPEDQWINTAPIGVNSRAVAGQVNFFDSASNVFNITGFRAVPIDYAGQEVDLWATKPRDHAEDIRICQRYFEKSYTLGVPLGTIANAGQMDVKVTGTNNMYGVLQFQTTKRGTPIPAFYSPDSGLVGFGFNGSDKAMTAFSGPTNERQMSWQMATATANTEMSFHWSADSEL